jgi:hypothetical protein
MRTEMINMGFLEIQTPIRTSSSPEGTRDYLVLQQFKLDVEMSFPHRRIFARQWNQSSIVRSKKRHGRR